MERRVVVTGYGAITPIGNNVEEFWNGIKEGKCGIDNITQFDATNNKVKLAAEIKNFNPEDHFDKRSAKRMDRYVQVALVAAREAMQHSGINEENIDMEKLGVIVGTGMGGLKTIEEQIEVMLEKGPDRISPMYIPMSITNMAAGNIAIETGAKGESLCMVSACATGTHSIGEAYRMVKHGYLDAAITGGTEATICPSAIAGFANIKALSQATDKKRASIPFDKERTGFIMGEGAGILIIEELEHAIKRGAKIYAEIVGYGATSDAYHITSPAPGGVGGARAMVDAMKEANIKPEEISYVNAHGTSTHLNDTTETAAIKLALGDAANKVMVSSTKGHTGHMLGAAGAVEAIVCIKAIEDGLVPCTLNYKVKDEECDLDVIPEGNRKVDVKYAISNSLGFGGHNSSILFKKYEN